MASVPWYGIKRIIRTRSAVSPRPPGSGSKPSVIISAAASCPSRRGRRGEVRRYGDDDLKRLKFIRSAQAAGFTLAEIGELIALDESDDRARVRALAEARVAALDVKIDEMREARNALAGLATACASKRGGPCPILRAFDPK